MEVDKERGRIGLSRKELLKKPEGYLERKPDDFKGGNRNFRGNNNNSRRGGFRKRF
jgi:hypothetical protein